MEKAPDQLLHCHRSVFGLNEPPAPFSGLRFNSPFSSGHHSRSIGHGQRPCHHGRRVATHHWPS